jgi:LPXTG-site transpeptidase (sortase) family protein
VAETSNPRTGSALLTFENVVDIGIFDGRLMSGSTATKTRPETPTAAETTGSRQRDRVPLALALMGLVLVIGGIVALSYVGFETYGTARIAAQNQSDLSAAFETRVDAGLTTTTTTAAPAETTTTVAATFEDVNDIPVFVDPNPNAHTAPQPAVPATWTKETAPAVGEPLGRIRIPEIGVDWIVVEGVSPTELKMGPGHYPGTAVPGQLGNAVISGHRTTYGAPFNRLDLLNPGDRFTVETVAGVQTYEVVSTSIVSPRDLWVTDQWEGSWLTMTTCNPKGSSRERLVVFSKLVAGPNAGLIANNFPAVYDPPTPPT